MIFKRLDIKAYWNNKMWLTWAWTRVILARLLMVYEEIVLTFASIVRAGRAILINESLDSSDNRALVKYQNSGKSSAEENSAFVIGWSGCRQNQFWLILAKMSSIGRARLFVVDDFAMLRFRSDNGALSEQEGRLMDRKTQKFCFMLWKMEALSTADENSSDFGRLSLDLETSDFLPTTPVSSPKTDGPPTASRTFEEPELDNREEPDAGSQPLTVLNYFEPLAQLLVEPDIGICSGRPEVDEVKEPCPPQESRELARASKSSNSTLTLSEPNTLNQEQSTLSPSVNYGHHVASDRPATTPTVAQTPSPSSDPHRQSVDKVPLPRQCRPDHAMQRCNINPHLRDFRWFMDRDPGVSNLLVIRVTEKGNILLPIMVFSSARWDKRKFHRILEDEELRLPEDLIRKFTFDDRGRHHVARMNYLKYPVQFCAIVPLEPRAYSKQWGSDEEKSRLFGPLESLLGISQLLSAAFNESKKWCKCRSERYKFGGPMILCDNTRCEIGWYHKRCVEMNEDSGSDASSDSDSGYEWLCRKCAKLPRKKIKIAEDLDMAYWKIAAESTNRVQQAKALDRAWQDHNWPPREEILRMFGRISHNMEVVADDYHKILSCDYIPSTTEISRTWVRRKDLYPRDMMTARSRGRELAYS